MTCIDAACKVLWHSSEPVHYTQLAKSTGYNAQTLESALSKELGRGDRSRVCRVGHGVYAPSTPGFKLLRRLLPKSCGLAVEGGIVEPNRPRFRGARVVHVNDELACVIAAWDRLALPARHQMLDLIRNELGLPTEAA